MHITSSSTFLLTTLFKTVDFGKAGGSVLFRLGGPKKAATLISISVYKECI